MRRLVVALAFLTALTWATPINLEDNRAASITSTTKQNIKIKKKTFKCNIKLVHNWDSVKLDKSSLKCSPGKPKKQKANNIKVSANDFEFLISVSINPSTITKAKITRVPTTTSIPTTTSPFPTTTHFETMSSFPTTFEGTPFPASTGGNCTCGQANRGTRIVNGEEAGVNEYPWMAGLVSSGDSFVWCGGSLISNQWVMTAAHCTESSSPGDIEVLLGEHDYYDNSETLSIRKDIAEIIIHPQYDSFTTDYDYSLLKLADPVDFNSLPHIRPICLPENTSEDYEEYVATVAGWGATSSGGSTSNYLQHVEVNVLSNEDCNSNEYSYVGAITQRMLCANVDGGGKDSCQGDSGGPLVVQNPDLFELIGVVSWGYGCAEAYAPGVYARVTKVLQWIAQSTLDSWSSCGRCEDSEECPGTISVGPVTGGPGTGVSGTIGSGTSPNTMTPFTTPPFFTLPTGSGYGNYTPTFGEGCMFNEMAIPLDKTIARAEKCEWMYCWMSESGPVIGAYSQFESVNCCLGEYEDMYQDGEVAYWSSGEELTCCKGRWMKPAFDDNGSGSGQFEIPIGR